MSITFLRNVIDNFYHDGFLPREKKYFRMRKKFFFIIEVFSFARLEILFHIYFTKLLETACRECCAPFVVIVVQLGYKCASLKLLLPILTLALSNI